MPRAVVTSGIGAWQAQVTRVEHRISKVAPLSLSLSSSVACIFALAAASSNRNQRLLATLLVLFAPRAPLLAFDVAAPHIPNSATRSIFIFLLLGNPGTRVWMLTIFSGSELLMRAATRSRTA